MKNRQFGQLPGQAGRGETGAVLAAGDLDPALLTIANEHGQRLLLKACYYCHLELATGLLDRGSDVHARTTRCWDALL